MAIDYMGGCCEQCGFTGHASAFDFHHRNPAEKDFGITSGSTKSWDKILAELEKCELLCANCHRTHHAL